MRTSLSLITSQKYVVRLFFPSQIITTPFWLAARSILFQYVKRPRTTLPDLFFEFPYLPTSLLLAEQVTKYKLVIICSKIISDQVSVYLSDLLLLQATLFLGDIVLLSTLEYSEYRLSFSAKSSCLYQFFLLLGSNYQKSTPCFLSTMLPLPVPLNPLKSFSFHKHFLLSQTR